MQFDCCNSGGRAGRLMTIGLKVQIPLPPSLSSLHPKMLLLGFSGSLHGSSHPLVCELGHIGPLNLAPVVLEKCYLIVVHLLRHSMETPASHNCAFVEILEL